MSQLSLNLMKTLLLGFFFIKKTNYLEVVEIKKVMEEMIKPRTIHTFHIRILIAPSKALFAKDSVNRV